MGPPESPNSLSDLVPRYLAEVPVSPVTGEPLHYADGTLTAKEPAIGTWRAAGQSGYRSGDNDHWVKISNTPPAWGNRIFQMTVFALDQAKETWEKFPCALPVCAVFGKGNLLQTT